jgi:hypothetical protein
MLQVRLKAASLVAGKTIRFSKPMTKKQRTWEVRALAT